MVASGIPITDPSRTSYPQYEFKSDEKWDTEKPDLLKNGARAMTGDGNISDHTLSVDCVVLPDGTITGRYHNTNGIMLDMNGYIGPETRTIYIMLGHGSEISYWKLSPQRSYIAGGSKVYEYEGVWGKSGKPSKMTFRLEE